MPEVHDIALANIGGLELDIETISHYKEIIQGSDFSEHARLLVFGEEESIELGRLALKHAARELGTYLRVTKQRGKRSLVVIKITEEEFEARQQAIDKRVAKTKKSRGRGK